MREQVEHENAEDERERQTTRRNLAFANVALAIAEAVDVIDDKVDRRCRATQEQTRRMFENAEKDYEEHTDIESPITEFDEDELAAEIEEFERELADRVDKD